MNKQQYSENQLIEQPTIKLFHTLGWTTANCFNEFDSGKSTLGRETPSEVVLLSKLKPALNRLNSTLPPEAIQLAIEEIIRDRSKMSLSSANREVYRLLKDGVKVEFKTDSGEDTTETVKVIDWNNPQNNDFFLASQFWILGDMYKRRADLVGFVNGIPLVFIELKASHKRLENAFKDNLRDYKNSIPQIFWYNAFIILSNGSESKIGSISAEWEHFVGWKKINSEGEKGIVSLETMIRGTCAAEKLIDLVENFSLFQKSSGGLIKILAKNHQYLGVNNAINAIQDIEKNKGRLGVFWHTQGSGKSFSMAFFSQKILRKVPGNWTFLVVTDRNELDNQIYENFADLGIVTESENRVRAESGEHLKELLKEDHRFLFTLIQKFHTERGEQYPKISDRSNIIVITDEAHRSQYDIWALNMRNALPKAGFIAFTGTPLIAGEEKTKDVFGNYVSIYNFKQSVDDNATVPLYYENRIPELQLKNLHLNDDIEQLIDEAELDEEKQKRLERELGRDYHLITRDDRLNKIAEDLAHHFMSRGYDGKAMFVAIDKATAVRMFDKVKAAWEKYRKQLEEKIKKAKSHVEAKELYRNIQYMEQTDMAVVVSSDQNEIEDFQKKGLDIRPHRERMNKEDLDTKFKNPDDPFRIVFVCAMWMTGFDVPFCSTIYLDKPMRNHTLMQTIARANRVYENKTNGLIVDYVGVFKNMEAALAIYGSDYRGGVKEGEMPVKDKKILLDVLKMAIEQAENFCKERGVDITRILKSEGFQRVRYLDDSVKMLIEVEDSPELEDSVDKIIFNDELKKKYLSLAGNVDRVYRAILPDRSANDYSPKRALFMALAEKILALSPEIDISDVMGKVEELLDKSIATEGYVIHGHPEERLIDISKIDFEKLSKKFPSSRKHIEVEKLKNSIKNKLLLMVSFNKSRTDYLEKFQKMIDEYNAGAYNVEVFFKKLVEFSQELKKEDQRAIAERLTEEELAIFDLLTKPDMTLTKKEEQEVKKVAKELLETLKKEKLVLDWRKKQQTRAAVQVAILNQLERLPSCYTNDLYQRKCEAVYQHVFDAYLDQNKNLYQSLN